MGEFNSRNEVPYGSMQATLIMMVQFGLIDDNLSEGVIIDTLNDMKVNSTVEISNTESGVSAKVTRTQDGYKTKFSNSGEKKGKRWRSNFVIIVSL